MQEVLDFFAQWGNRLYETFIVDGNYLQLLTGFGNTLLITVCALLIGVALGTTIALMKFLAGEQKALKPLAVVCDCYVTAIRGIPVVVLLLIFYFLILRSADGVVTGIVTFGINSGAYMAEIIRAGIETVDRGQNEAARSLGLSRVQSMRRVILPQAVKNILPAVGNEMIALLKETSVAGYVAVIDLTRAANLIRNNTYDAFNPLMVTAVVYLTLVVVMTRLLAAFERRLRESAR
ncbi:MAG: amino acid ABC transporter permease [Eubacteriales bacterium]|nr:amino acid ABC transporter permease [Eubacteriales bacterium]